MTKGIILLGSTGSTGVSALDVISRHPDKYHVHALSANSNVATMFEQCRRFQPEKVVMVNPQGARELEEKIVGAGLNIELESGAQALSAIAAGSGDIVVCGIVGAAGLMSTIAAVEAGKKVLVANKEPLVMLGEYIVGLARKNNACLLPIDSEHNAIFQCLPQQIAANQHGNPGTVMEQGVQKILLTGSGGPLRTLPLEQLASVTPDQACAHPNWKMGRKISVDSATMMNKGLELIEACALFGVPASKVQIVVHPQSVIHSMVEYVDGSILAQLGSPDMRVPIANALGWPDRIESGAKSLDWLDISRFDFEPPDHERFPSLQLAQYAVDQGGTLPAIMNAANEIAVEAFLKGQISFNNISILVEKTMNQLEVQSSNDLESVLEADHAARTVCNKILSKLQ